MNDSHYDDQDWDNEDLEDLDPIDRLRAEKEMKREQAGDWDWRAGGDWDNNLPPAAA